jgi:predicted ABC-type ATPase
MLNCREFINADEIAKGLSPFQPDKVAIEAGRIMLHRIKDLISHQVDFAFETTLATKSYTNFIKEAQSKGYFVTLLYFWLNSPDLAIERVKSRVMDGGHDIPVETIKRRYRSGISNLAKLYIPICDYWMIIDNSHSQYHTIAEGFKNEEIEIYHNEIYTNITSL